MKEPILVVLAAGMGSRYGGLKQIDPVGPTGELIIDYSVFDAVQAGFRRVVFIIKPELEEEFECTIAARVRPHAQVAYAYQQLTDLPGGYAVPAGRTKPWGTAHALCAAREIIDAPFAVINADDYYGPNAYKQVYEFLSQPHREDHLAHFTLVSYPIESTVTEHGSVARGICQVENGFLTSIRERLNITCGSHGIFDEGAGGERVLLPKGTPVSMNLWGLTPAYVDWAWKRFPSFLDAALVENPMKSEFLLPTTIFEMLTENMADVSVTVSPDHWYGVTYQQDKDGVVAALQRMHDKGSY